MTQTCNYQPHKAFRDLLKWVVKTNTRFKLRHVDGWIKLSMYSLRNNFISPVGNMTPKMRRNWQITSLNVILQYVFSRWSQSVDFLERSELKLSRFHSPLLSVTVGLLYSRWTPGRIVFVFFCLPLPFPAHFLRRLSTLAIDKPFTQSESHM